MRKAIIPAFLLLLGSTVLGATVLREPLAKAAVPIASVFVTNDASHPVPVHEQGTANVNVTNSSLQVAAPTPITAGGRSVPLVCETQADVTGVATALAIHMNESVVQLLFFDTDAGHPAASFLGPALGGNSDVVLALTRPIAFSHILCVGSGSAVVNWVGNEP
jgi:hypothetical protein